MHVGGTHVLLVGTNIHSLGVQILAEYLFTVAVLRHHGVWQASPTPERDAVEGVVKERTGGA